MTLLDDLKALDALFADPAKWTTGTMARDANGEPCSVKAGCSFCIIGGTVVVCGLDPDRLALLRDAIRNATGEASLSVANDADGLPWVRRAIKTAIKVTGGEYAG